MGESVIRRATILADGPGGLLVRVEREGGEDCGGCRSCALKKLCQGRDGQHLDLVVSAAGGSGRAPGETVRVAYREPNAAVAAVVMFVPALAGLLLGGVLAHRFFPGDAALLAGCGIGLAAGFAVTFILARLLPGLGPSARLADANE